MALSSDDIEQVVETIIHGSEEKLISELTETIVREFANGLIYSAEVDLLTLSRAFPAKASVILLKYRDRISEEVQSEIEDTLNAAVEEDLENLAKIYGTVAAAKGASTHFAQVSKQTAIGVSQIIERQNVALSQSLQETWYKVSAEAVTAVNQGLKPREKVLADGVVKLMDAGINVIPYHKDGKPTVTNHVDVAMRRHITTQVSQAGGRMALEAMDLYNHDLVITDAHYGARESHAYWQGLPCCRSGQKTIDGVTYPDMVSLTEYGSVTGLKGANCRHMIFPYFPSITKLPDREFKEQQEKFGMTSDEYYAATQRQRELERRVRKTKREIAGLEEAGIGFENPTYVNKRLLLGSQQKTLNTFCKENKLVRLYEREKAYGVAKQPRALLSKPKAIATRRKAFIDKLSSNSSKITASGFDKAKDIDELTRLVERKYGTKIINANHLDFEAVKRACCGIDEVLSDFPKASEAWMSLVGKELSPVTFMETNALGSVAMNETVFSRLFDEALSTGRHEGGHILEVAMAALGKGDPAARYTEAKDAKRILTNALKKMNKEAEKKTTIDKVIDSISTYPAREAVSHGDRSYFYSEGLAVCTEKAYNGEAEKYPFISFVIDELRKSLS